jgi:anti-sigma-K factor RskA
MLRDSNSLRFPKNFMKPFEVGIIVAAAAVILYLFYSNAATTQPNVATLQGPLQCGGNLNTGPVT